MIYDISHALSALVPGAVWVVRGDSTDYGNLEWNDTSIDRPSNIRIQKWIDDKNAEEPMRLMRIERDKLLAATDWWGVSDRAMTQEQIDYRQALRDLTNTATPGLLENGKLDPNSVRWPTKP
jgi:hypothetical protein